MSALTLPRVDGESLDDYAKRCIQDASEQAKDAAQRGTDIHGSLEKYYQTGKIQAEHSKMVCGTVDAVNEEFGNLTWLSEKSFSSLEHGYGGKIDLHGDNLVIDFKTKEFGEGDKKLHWEEQAIQLAAYAYGLGMPDATLANVFVSVTNPGLVKVHIWKESTAHYFEGFRRMLELWKWTKGYDASQEVTK
jgi:CRISPR/Cas system-associated exonuclease Cas4 (RecB family)